MSGHYYLEFELVSKFQRWSYTSTPEQDLDFWAALQFGIPHLLCQLFYLLPKSLSELPSNEYLILSLFSSQTDTCWEAWIVYSKVVAFAVCCFSGTIKEGFSLISVRSWFFNYFFQFLCLTSFIQINTIIMGKLFLPIFFKRRLEKSQLVFKHMDGWVCASRQDAEICLPGERWQTWQGSDTGEGGSHCLCGCQCHPKGGMERCWKEHLGS